MFNSTWAGIWAYGFFGFFFFFFFFFCGLYLSWLAVMELVISISTIIYNTLFLLVCISYFLLVLLLSPGGFSFSLFLYIIWKRFNIGL